MMPIFGKILERDRIEKRKNQYSEMLHGNTTDEVLMHCAHAYERVVDERQFWQDEAMRLMNRINEIQRGYQDDAKL